MDAVLLAIMTLAIFGLLLSLFFRKKRKNVVIEAIPEDHKQLLEEQVPFYKNLGSAFFGKDKDHWCKNKR